MRSYDQQADNSKVPVKTHNKEDVHTVADVLCYCFTPLFLMQPFFKLGSGKFCAAHSMSPERCLAGACLGSGALSEPADKASFIWLCGRGWLRLT